MPSIKGEDIVSSALRPPSQDPILFNGSWDRACAVCRLLLIPREPKELSDVKATFST
jgi:hypothetical protein